MRLSFFQMLDFDTAGFCLHLQGILLQLRFTGIVGRKRALVIMYLTDIKVVLETVSLPGMLFDFGPMLCSESDGIYRGHIVLLVKITGKPTCKSSNLR